MRHHWSPHTFLGRENCCIPRRYKVLGALGKQNQLVQDLCRLASSFPARLSGYVLYTFCMFCPCESTPDDGPKSSPTPTTSCDKRHGGHAFASTDTVCFQEPCLFKASLCHRSSLSPPGVRLSDHRAWLPAPPTPIPSTPASHLARAYDCDIRWNTLV